MLVFVPYCNNIDIFPFLHLIEKFSHFPLLPADEFHIFYDELTNFQIFIPQMIGKLLYFVFSMAEKEIPKGQ